MTSHPLANERGLTLIFTMVLVIGLLTLAIAGMISASSDLRISRNYTTGLQAVLAAEAGLLHAQVEVENSGVVDLQDVVAEWSTLFGLTSRPLSGYADVSYSVAATSHALTPATKMVVTATGNAPDEAMRQIEAILQLGAVYSPGAIYLPAAGVATSFSGNNFLVDGNDTDLNGIPTGETVPGIAVPDETSASTVAGTLNSPQQDNVIGSGGNTSVLPAGGPDVAAITGDLVPNITSRLGTVINPLLLGNDTFGTVALPQITYFTGDLTISGDVSGAGILVVDGGLTVTGNMVFTGLIIVNGTTEITSLSGNSTIVGSLWTTDLALDVSGSASVTYSSEALELADAIGAFQLLPKKLQLVSWREL